MIPLTMMRRLSIDGCGAGVALLCGALLVLAGANAAGQQKYELTEAGWEAIDAPAPDSPEGKLQAIRKTLAEGKADRAFKSVSKWIKEHPDHPLTVEAYLLRGDARVAGGNFYKALHDYEYLIRRYPASEQFAVALEREYQIARMFINGKKRKVLGMRLLPATGDAAEILIRIQERAPGSAVGEKAHLLLGDHYFNSGQMVNAAEAYDLFLLNYPYSDQREFAMLRVVQANLARYKGPAFDQRGLIEAQQRLRLYTMEYPAAAEQIGAEALMFRIRESLSQRDVITADWYTQRGESLSAAVLYRRVITDYPDTAAAGDAVDRLESIGYPVVLATDATDAQRPIDTRRAPRLPVQDSRPDGPAEIPTTPRPEGIPDVP